MKCAIVTGITGQDGAYLSKLLLDKGYRVYGAYRHNSTQTFWRINDLGIRNHPNLHLIGYDLTDFSSIVRMIHTAQPTEIYNLAAQSFVGLSFEQPLTTAEINAMGPLNLLEAIRILDPKIRFYQASTSEMYGKVQAVPQNENTPFYPRSPYSIAKLMAHWMTRNYADSYNIFGCSGILFNHESPLRGKDFVTRKISDGVARIKLGLTDHLELGNMNAKRDWGHAQDYVEGMWMMLQQDQPDTYVLATGRTETVRSFVEMAFAAADIQVYSTGKGEEETIREVGTDRLLVRVNPLFYRPAEVDLLIGDSAKAKQILGWESKTSLEELCRGMVEADLTRVKKELL
jgi:GDPmannose 4,6-dehydratase